MKESNPLALSTDNLKSRIYTIRGMQVMLDIDLAELYNVKTKVLNQAVKRNSERFPENFMFQLTISEKDEVVTNCDYLKKLRFSPNNPYAFIKRLGQGVVCILKI